MIRFLRRRQPANPLLAAAYWVVILAMVLAALFVVFYLTDNILPGQGMF